MEAISRSVREMGLWLDQTAPIPESTKRFPDGAQYRVEIPSTEGPACLRATIEEARGLDVLVHRVSQGSGVFMLTDSELDEMVTLARDAKIEISLFLRPNAAWSTSAMALAPAGSSIRSTAFGPEQLLACLQDARRAAEHGVRSVLVADLGVLYALGELKRVGELPPDLQAKISVMLPVTNPATARVVEQLGAATINLPTDLTLSQIAAIRAVVDLPLDIYVESPDNLGGFVRHHEIPELIRIAAPVYLKFGLRNAPDIYPSGTHLESTAVALSRERVRRARLGLELLQRYGTRAIVSELGATGLAVPESVASGPW